MSRKPDFLVIGAQKSASTFLQVCLTDHPEIWMPRGETAYFEDPDYAQLDAGYLDRLLAPRAERLVGVKRPNWIGLPEVPARICHDYPDTRLIAVLRNPIDRAVSAYYHYIRGGFLPALDLNEGMLRILDDEGFRQRHPRSPEITEFGMYHRYLSMYEAFWVRGALLVLLHEDVSKAPEESVRTIYRHLGADEGHMPTTLAARPQAVVYHLGRLRALRRMALATSRFDPTRTRRIGPKNRLAEAAFAAYWRFDKTILAKVMPNRRPVLSDEVRGRLVDHYREDIAGLGEMLERDLSAWTRYPARAAG